ncbi:membrane hypothetical protein [Burkholderiales bacterium 8X]|nr:membrane hypothetical protein [Burkholderiales bacterium 8X]
MQMTFPLRFRGGLRLGASLCIGLLLACSANAKGFTAAPAALSPPAAASNHSSLVFFAFPWIASACIGLVMLANARMRRTLLSGLQLFVAYIVFLVLLLLVPGGGGNDELSIGVLGVISPWMLFLLLLCGLITTPDAP